MCIFEGIGRGVFAGRPLRANNIFSVSPTVTISSFSASLTQLKYYESGCGFKDFVMLAFGPDSFSNHGGYIVNTAAEWHWYSDSFKDPHNPLTLPYTNYSPQDLKTKRTINPGEELFMTYGDSSWFEHRGIDMVAEDESCANKRCSRPLEDLAEYGHCLTDVEVKPSLIPNAGRGLFATRSFAAGEVVSISPALILPKHIIGSPEAHSVLLNYAFSVSGSDVALLPLGLGAMSNHGGSDSNMHVEWFDWSSGASGVTPSAVSDNSVYELESRKFAPVDIAYVARRSISEGEELTIDYGPEWTRAWVEHSCRVLFESVKSDSDSEIAPVPVFLHYIGAPDDLFPLEWEEASCIGKLCELTEDVV